MWSALLVPSTVMVTERLAEALMRNSFGSFATGAAPAGPVCVAGKWAFARTPEGRGRRRAAYGRPARDATFAVAAIGAPARRGYQLFCVEAQRPRRWLRAAVSAA